MLGNSELPMQIAILGGSFNPPHVCHLLMSCYALATTDVDQVWWVPCYRHAFGKDLLSFEHRFAMCRLAVEPLGEHRMVVSAIEQERQGISWTIDTVRYIHQQFPKYHMRWIIGSDVLGELERWKEFDQLQQLVSFLVIPRAGFALDSLLPIETLAVELPNISSSMIRDRVKQRQTITSLVPRSVEAYIRQHHLYET